MDQVNTVDNFYNIKLIQLNICHVYFLEYYSKSSILCDDRAR